MTFRARVFLFVVCCCISVCASVQAKSIYAISRHSNSTLGVYTINPDGRLNERYSGLLPNNGSGAIDLAVNTRDNIIFSSYDGVNVIEALSTKTMERVGTLTISGSTENEIAGLEYCRTHNLLLAAERYDTSIRVIEFDLESREFTRNMEIQMPYVDSGGILGLSLDETDEQNILLYISQSNPSTLVRYYRLTVDNGDVDVLHLGDIPIRVDHESKVAVGVAVDQRPTGIRYLYTAGYNHENPQEHPYIIRTTLSSDHEVLDRLGVPVAPYTYVAGVETDDETGYLYMTTLGVSSSVRVYDPNQWTSDPNDCLPLQVLTGPDIGGPAGITIGPNLYAPDRIQVSKAQIDPDPNYCISPNTFVTYRTMFRQGLQDEYDIVLTESLPEESLFVSADPNTGFYDGASHTYTWPIGDLPGLDPNVAGDPNQYFDMTVYVTQTAEPGGRILNTAEVESREAYAKAVAETAVCCWIPEGPVYVDAAATGHNSGVDWKNAYENLSDALNRIANGCGSEIWIAEGTYSPGNSTTDTFVLPDNVQVYGGFAGNETARDQRNWQEHPTVLTGYIDIDTLGNDVQSDIIVTMGDNSLMDGLVIEAAEMAGIDADDVDFTVKNCLLENHDRNAIQARNGILTVDWCQIRNNGQKGIQYVSDSNSIAVIAHSQIYGNGWDGICIGQANASINNCLLYQNACASDTESKYAGIRLMHPRTDTVIRNNTIVANHHAGIYVQGGIPPLVLNSIVWDNTDVQLAGFEADAAAFYSCIQDCNEVNYNINLDPAFAYRQLPTPNHNYHLAWDSPCVDAGDGMIDPNEFDIDGQIRVYGEFVDIGADEAAACDPNLTPDDIYHPGDWNADGIINHDEFSRLAETWLYHDPNDPSILTDPNDTSDPNYVSPETIFLWRQLWDPDTNIETRAGSAYQIDLADLKLFWNDYWLWIACWKEPQYPTLWNKP